jgi:Tfp pilus assembly protein PilO
MSLSSIKRKTAERLRAADKGLRAAAAVFTLLLAANALVYFAVLAPSSARLEACENKLDGLRKRRAEAVLFEKRKTLFAGLLRGVPSQKDMPILVKEYMQEARRRGLTVAAINYDMPKRGSGELAELAFTFPAEGRYPDIKRFIYEAETSDRLVGISGVKLESGKNGRVKLTMKLMTYVKGQ